MSWFLTSAMRRSTAANQDIRDSSGGNCNRSEIASESGVSEDASGGTRQAAQVRLRLAFMRAS
jgi:hypothetical protein